MFDSSIDRLRVIAFIEGLSFLVLLFIAMPMKYILGDPIPVKIVGMSHGVLFIIFIYLLIAAAREHQWSLKFNFYSFLMSLIPFGTFFLEKKLKKISVKK